MSAPAGFPRRRLVVWAAIGAAAAAAGGSAAALVVSRGPADVHVVTRPSSTTVSSTTTTTPASSTTAPATTTTVTAPAGPTAACGALLRNGSATSATASLGTVTARLSGTATTAYGMPTVGAATLTVTDGGRTVLSAPVLPPKDMVGAAAVLPWDLSGSTLGAPSSGASPGAAPQPVCLARFAGASAPAVVLGLNLGGAHCCVVVRTFQVPDGMTGEVDLGNAGATVVGRAGGALIVTGDNAFNYQFASYADSGVPLKTLELSGGSLVDTTRRHPDLVAEDAARWKQAAFSPTSEDRLGVLAAWVADECLLGRSASALQTVDLLNQQGSLTGPAGWPTGAAYVSALRSFLTGHGYPF